MCRPGALFVSQCISRLVPMNPLAVSRYRFWKKGRQSAVLPGWAAILGAHRRHPRALANRYSPRLCCKASRARLMISAWMSARGRSVGSQMGSTSPKDFSASAAPSLHSGRKLKWSAPAIAA
ncbi:hypothetical protein D9M70_543400 [compost metagenome]